MRVVNSPQTGYQIEFGRREFLATVSASVLSGVAVLLGTTDIEERILEKPLKERLLEEASQNRRSLLSTSIESIVLWAGNTLVATGIEKLGIRHGAHAGEGELFENQYQEHPVRSHLRDSVLTPLIEEAIFRLLPSSFLDGHERANIRWDVGLTSNVIFSLLHNFANPEENRYTLSLQSLPLVQFILGAYCWHLQRTAGFMHAAGAHILYNNLCAAYEHFEKDETPSQEQK